MGLGTTAHNNGAGQITTAVYEDFGLILPPTVVTPPQSQTVAQGSPVTFTVGVSGEAPFTYQWRKGGAPIDGANGASYTINNAQPSDEASYDVIVSNLVGSATSAAATLAIMVAPEITQQPASLTVVCGTTATFTVAASGTSPNYQWYYNDTNLLTGETSASLVLNNVM